ncbi:MAG TPA: ABC transporter permease [Acidimicrobiia bacterium]|nr:ABC transporter permease [Acidimicrobiia bacterium]
MRTLWIVMKREVIERVRSKAFLVSTGITLTLVGGVVVALSFAQGSGPPSYQVAIVGRSTPTLNTSLQLAAAASNALVSSEPIGSVDAARSAVEAGRVDGAIAAPDLVIVRQAGGSQLETILTIALEQTRFVDGLEAAGVAPETVSELFGPGNRVAVEGVEEADDESDAIVASLGVILLFLVITMYGQWVLMGVMEEKSNRVVELIVAAVPVRTLLWAKVIGIGILGLLQLALLLGLGLGAAMGLDVVDLPTTTIPTALWAVAWFILGFAFYAVIYAAAGSLVSRQEDAQTAVMPVALGTVAIYMTTFLVIVPNPETTTSAVLSLLPPFAPIAMPPRIALDAAAAWEVAAAIVLMVAATVGVVRLAARIYTGAILRSGARIKLRDAWRSARDMAG